MNISRLFIVRPVATALLMISVVLVGLVSVAFLPVSSLPDVDYPTIQVQTFYPGASPQVTSTTVTAPLEVQLGRIPGLQQMTSSSSATASIITLQFDLSIDLDVAEQNVQEAINAANSFLPSGLPAPPTYAKVNPADQPILTLAVTSKAMSLTQLQDIANNRLASKIAEVPGVGLVSPSGGNVPAIRVEADPQKLAAYGLNIDDLRTLLGNITVSQPKGNFDGPELDYTINDNDQISDPQDYLNTVISYQNGSPVLLRDVATVSQAAQNIEQGAWFNGTACYRAQRAAPAGRQRHQDRQPDQATAAAAAGKPAAIDACRHRGGQHRGDPLLGRRCLLRAGARDRTGRPGDLRFPAQRAGNDHPQHFRAGVADRHAGGDVQARLLDRQSVADGADHRHRLRRRRFDRDDRERRALPRRRHAAARRRADRGRADRLHHSLADRVADRGAHSPAVHGRRDRPSVQ